MMKRRRSQAGSGPRSGTARTVLNSRQRREGDSYQRWLRAPVPLVPLIRPFAYNVERKRLRPFFFLLLYLRTKEIKGNSGTKWSEPAPAIASRCAARVNPAARNGTRERIRRHACPHL